MIGMRALFVGVSTFEARADFPPLPRAEADATALSTMLGEPVLPDRERRVLRSPRLEEVLASLDWLYERREEPGIRVLFVSSHGVRMPSGDVGFACADSSASDWRRIVRFDDLYERAYADAMADEHVLLLDFCFSGAFARRTAPASLGRDLSVTTLASSAGTYSTWAKISDDERFASGRLSSFTRSLWLALAGVCAYDQEQRLTIPEIADLAAVEAIRLSQPSPFLTRQGATGGPTLPVPDVPDALPPRINRRSPTQGPRVVVGSDGIRTVRAAVGLLGMDGARILDGRSHVQFGITTNTVGWHPLGRRAVVVEMVHGDDVWQTVELALREGHAAATVNADFYESLRQTPDDVYVVPPVSESDVHRALTEVGIADHALLPEPWDPDFFIREAGDSEERLAALCAAALPFHRPEVASRAADSESLPPPTVDEVVATALAGAADSLPVQILWLAPGIFVHADLLRQFAAEAEKMAVGRDGIDELVRAQLLERIGQWVRLRPAFAHATPVVDAARFVDFVRFALSNTDALRRLQLLRAVAAFSHRSIEQASNVDEVVATLDAAGADLLSVAGAQPMLTLFNALLTLTGGEATAGLLTQYGHALRLRDDYATSQEWFKRAEQQSSTQDERVAARAGRVAAVKNVAAGASDLQNLLPALKFSAPEAVDTESPRTTAATTILADVLVQRANMLFSSSKWDEAELLYQKALEMLDPTSPLQAPLYIDVAKGLADVAMHRDDRRTMDRLATEMLDVVAEHYLVRLARWRFAKTVQFVGDLHRRRVVSHERVPQLAPEHFAPAQYWLDRALSQYSRQELALGECMTLLKLGHLDTLRGEADRAYWTHVQLIDQFAEMRNSLWAYRARVAALLNYALLEGRPPTEANTIRAAVQTSVESGERSLYHQAWGVLVLGGETAADQAATVFETVGSASLARLVRSSGISTSLAAYH